jgi:hypothetical protein
MLRVKVWTTVACLCALGASAAARGDGFEFRVRILDETAPAGSIVQMKLRTYEVTPISISSIRFPFDATVFDGVDAVTAFATYGEVAGAAVIDGNNVALAYVTTEPLTVDEYPFAMISLRIRPDAAVGSRSEFTLDPSSRWVVGGRTVPATVTPGTVTVGGSVAITDVVPGGGWVPAGTVVSVRGVGFNRRSRLKVDDLNIGAVRVVSSTEIQFTLRQAANMTAQRLRVDNPDDSRSTYYSYMRGVPAATSSRSLLAMTQPIFSGRTRFLSTIGPIAAMDGGQYAGLALQNPHAVTANVTIALSAADGTFLHSSTRSLEQGTRLALELSELLDGVPPPPGASVRVISSSPIAAFGLWCDEGAWTVTPQLPIEAVTAGGGSAPASPE